MAESMPKPCCEFHADEGCALHLEPCCDHCPALDASAEWEHQSARHPTAHLAVALERGWRTLCGRRWVDAAAAVSATESARRCARCAAKRET